MKTASPLLPLAVQSLRVILRLWLFLVLTLAGALAPSRASARVAETRTEIFFAATTESRQQNAPQVADWHPANPLFNYETASGYAQAAESALDWSIVSKSGETRADHIALHEAQNLQKASHGVFYGDSQAAVNDAWSIAQQQGIKPISSGVVDIYVVPRPNSGFAGGFTGQGQNLNTVTIITQQGTNKIITGFPGNATPPPFP